MFLSSVYHNLYNCGENNAICLDGQYTSYKELGRKVAGIRAEIRRQIPAEEKGVGLVAFSHPDTYAAIIALWLESKYYVPMLPFAPLERNRSVVRESGVGHVLTNSTHAKDMGAVEIYVDTIEPSDSIIPFDESGVVLSDIAYLMFTSGSTGVPKGVPISFDNLEAYCVSMNELGLDVREDDRCLQMFELTFDLSLVSYLPPFCAGACLYLIPDQELKASYILDLLEEYHLTVLNLVPSVLTYLKRFFPELRVEETRLCMFCGEALMEDVTRQWQKCIPNCKILNCYGPTENTIFCTTYLFDETNVKSHNGVISIGRDMPGNASIIIDEMDNEIADNEVGELCLSGHQLTQGYWAGRNPDSFFVKNGIRYYRTGDLCYKDAEGDCMYIGRKDFQAKIQGFRVELSEIEHYAKEAVPEHPECVCVAYESNGITQIGLAVHSRPVDDTVFTEYIASKLPPYEVPSKVLFYDAFPYNTNGKTDRKSIKRDFENE